jgi:hypothetical protein
MPRNQPGANNSCCVCPKVVKAPRGTPGKKPPAPAVRSRHSVRVVRVARARTVNYLSGDGQSRCSRRVH